MSPITSSGIRHAVIPALFILLLSFAIPQGSFLGIIASLTGLSFWGVSEMVFTRVNNESIRAEAFLPVARLLVLVSLFAVGFSGLFFTFQQELTTAAPREILQVMRDEAYRLDAVPRIKKKRIIRAAFETEIEASEIFGTNDGGEFLILGAKDLFGRLSERGVGAVKDVLTSLFIIVSVLIGLILLVTGFASTIIWPALQEKAKQ